MGVINKLEIKCGSSPVYIVTIGLEDTNDTGINAVLGTIPPAYGVYTYSHTVVGGIVTSILNVTGNSGGCNASLFKDGRAVSSQGTCCISIEPSELISGQLGNDLEISTVDGKLYVTNGAETNTPIIGITDGFQYTNELGVPVVVTYTVNGTNMEVKVDGSVVSVIPLTLNEIQIDNAGSDFDLTDDQLTFLETNGDSATISFAKYNVTSTLNGDGSITITQNGVTIATIPAPQPAAVLTNNAAPFSWNTTTQQGNIPTPTITPTATGWTINLGDGTAPTNITDDNTEAAITVNGVTYPIGTDFETILAAINAITHVPAVVTNIAAPYSFNASTQTLNIPQVPSIVNGQLVQGDGTPAEQIPDNWRVGRGATGALPDGTNDVTEKIGHQSDIYVGADALVTVGHGGGDVASNTVLGNFALESNTIGFQNTALGLNSLFSNTTGYNNTGNGSYSLNKNINGLNNTANGVEALYANISGNNNTATGVYSLNSNISGYHNTSNGMQSLFSNTIGDNNTAIGRYSMFSNVIASNNSAIGAESLFSNVNGNNNTASGFQSAYANTSGNNNSAYGFHSLYHNTENIQNTAIGSRSFDYGDILTTAATLTASTSTQVTISPALMGGWTIGDHVYLNFQAPFLSSISQFYEGTYKIINATTLEVLKPNTVLSTTGNVNSVEVRQGRKINNATALGYDAEPTASNQVMLGNTAVTQVRTSGAYFGTAFNVVSDKRNKYVGDVVVTKELYGSKINVYEYQLISDGTWHIGVLAQDVREIETKRGKFILTSESEGVNYGATVESFNKQLGTEYKFFSEINKDAEIIKEQLLQNQGITKEEATKLKEIYDTIVRESQEYILDEEGKPTDIIKYDGRFDKQAKKYKGKEIDADKLYNSLIVIEKDMLSLSTQINILL